MWRLDLMLIFPALTIRGLMHCMACTCELWRAYVLYGGQGMPATIELRCCKGCSRVIVHNIANHLINSTKAATFTR